MSAFGSSVYRGSRGSSLNASQAASRRSSKSDADRSVGTAPSEIRRRGGAVGRGRGAGGGPARRPPSARQPAADAQERRTHSASLPAESPAQSSDMRETPEGMPSALGPIWQQSVAQPETEQQVRGAERLEHPPTLNRAPSESDLIVELESPLQKARAALWHLKAAAGEQVGFMGDAAVESIAAVQLVDPNVNRSPEVEALPWSSPSNLSPVEADTMPTSSVPGQSPLQDPGNSLSQAEQSLTSFASNQALPSDASASQFPVEQDMTQSASVASLAASSSRQRDVYTFGPDEVEEALRAQSRSSHEPSPSPPPDIMQQDLSRPQSITQFFDAGSVQMLSKPQSSVDGSSCGMPRHLSGSVSQNSPFMQVAAAPLAASATPNYSLSASASSTSLPYGTVGGYLSGGALVSLEAAAAEAATVVAAARDAEAFPASALGLRDWKLERSEQEKRLEAMLLQSQQRGARWQSSVQESKDVLKRADSSRFTQLTIKERLTSSRLEEAHSSECARRDVAGRRAQLGVLDSVAMEANVGASRNAMLQQQQHRMEEELAKLRKRQEVAEEAARRCWLATAARSIGASAVRYPAGSPPQAAV